MAQHTSDASTGEDDVTGVRVAIIATLFAGLILILSAAAFADNTNPSRVHGADDPNTGMQGSSTPTNGSGNVSANGNTAGSDALGASGRPTHPLLIAGATIGVPDSISVLRVANFGPAGGVPTVVIVDPATGQTLATWNGPEIPAQASLQQSVDSIAAAATREPAVSALPSVVNLLVSATFPGSVQHLTGNGVNGLLTDASVCSDGTTASNTHIGYAPADTDHIHSWVRLVNSGEDAASIDLIVHDAASGHDVGTWTSPSVPSRGTRAVPLTTLLTDANVPNGPTAFEIASRALPKGMRLELEVTDAISGATANQTVSCTLGTANPGT